MAKAKKKGKKKAASAIGTHVHGAAPTEQEFLLAQS
jgi:hypothetical protein